MHVNVSNSPRATFWEWAQAALLAGNLLWTTVCLGGYRADTKVVTWLLTCALMGVHLLARVIERRENSRPAHPAGWLVMPFLVCAIANVLWVTPVPWLGWFDALGWMQMMVVFWVTLNALRSVGPRGLVVYALVGGGLIGVVLACYQRFVAPDWIIFGRTSGSGEGRASGTFGLANSFAGYLLLILPAVGALAFRRSARMTERVWWGWVSVVLLLGLLLTISRGAWIALAVALMVWPLAAGRGTWWRRLRVAAVVFAAVGVAGTITFFKWPAFRTRFNALVSDNGERSRPVLWRAGWKLFLERPALGTGAGSFNALFDRHRPEQFPVEPLWAHNDYLNTLSDYGAVGFALCFGAMLAIGIRSARAPKSEGVGRRDALDSPTVAAGWAVGLLAFGLQLTLEFHWKLPALAMAFAIVAALAVARRWPISAGVREAASTMPLGRWVGLAAIVAICGVAAWSAPKLRAEAFRQAARRSMDRVAMAGAEKTADLVSVLPRAVFGLRQATALDARNGDAWSDLSYAAALTGNVESERRSDWARESEAAANSALACGPSVAEFWIRRGVARDLQGRWAEAGADFQRAVAIAPMNSNVWFRWAEHLSYFKGTRDAAIAAVECCLRLDPGNTPGLALRQRLAIKSKPN